MISSWCLITYFSLRPSLQFYAVPGVVEWIEVTNQPIRAFEDTDLPSDIFNLAVYFPLSKHF